jgi:hypothetical protein
MTYHRKLIGVALYYRFTSARAPRGAAGVALRQSIEQRPGLLQIRGVEPFGEPAIDRRQQRMGLSPLALLLPEATEAHGGPQLQ